MQNATRQRRHRRRRRRRRIRKRVSVPVPSYVTDWSELPLDLLCCIFTKLGAVEILMGAGLVCHSWLEAAKVPDLWRCVDFEHHVLVRARMRTPYVMCRMAKLAVDRSDGRMEVFTGNKFVTDELLMYIAQRSPCLKSLSLMSCHDVSNEGFIQLVTKSPLLEELLISGCKYITGDAYEVVGIACVHLKRFMLRRILSDLQWGAHGIVTMHQLQYLTIVGGNINNQDLRTIIDSCPHIERLCVRLCLNMVVDDALRARCDKIKTVIFPGLHDDTFWSTDKFDDWRCG